MKHETDVVICHFCNRSVLRSETVRMTQEHYICKDCIINKTPKCFMCGAIIDCHGDLCESCGDVIDDIIDEEL